MNYYFGIGVHSRLGYFTGSEKSNQNRPKNIALVLYRNSAKYIFCFFFDPQSLRLIMSPTRDLIGYPKYLKYFVYISYIWVFHICLQYYEYFFKFWIEISNCSFKFLVKFQTFKNIFWVL